MDKLRIEDILKGLKDGKFKPNYIIELLENKQLDHLDSDEIDEIALTFDNDEDKIAILKYAFIPTRIIETLKTEESIVKAIGELKSDEQKVNIALKFLKKDENRLRIIKEIKDEDKAFPIKILLSRDYFKKYFLKGNKKYDKIGLDKDITIGTEIESLGENSQKILVAGENNGKTIHKEKGIDCGKIIKRR